MFVAKTCNYHDQDFLFVFIIQHITGIIYGWMQR